MLYWMIRKLFSPPPESVIVFASCPALPDDSAGPKEEKMQRLSETLSYQPAVLKTAQNC